MYQPQATEVWRKFQCIGRIISFLNEKNKDPAGSLFFFIFASMNLVFATNNQHKLNEIRSAAGSGIGIISLHDMNIQEEIPETQETLEGNAIQKAEYIAKRYKTNCFADDTGLEVKALDGKPGVYSARYAGENCSFMDNVEKLLNEMQGVTDRTAKFRTVIACSIDGRIYTFEGAIEGWITEEVKGEKGFGYDPVFQPKGFQETFAEMSLEQKNTISHRGKAVEKFVRFLKGGQ